MEYDKSVGANRIIEDLKAALGTAFDVRPSRLGEDETTGEIVPTDVAIHTPFQITGDDGDFGLTDVYIAKVECQAMGITQLYIYGKAPYLQAVIGSYNMNVGVMVDIKEPIATVAAAVIDVCHALIRIDARG